MAPPFRTAPDTFEVPAKTNLPELDELSGVSRADPAEPQVLDATYFDTENLDLLGSSITIRRQTGGDQGWHLQLPAAAGHHDIRIPLGRAVRTVPKPLRRAVAIFTGGEDLAAIASLQTHRRLHRLSHGAGPTVAEVAEEEVTAQLNGATGEQPTPQTWRQWQVNVAEPDTDLHRRLVDSLAEAGARRSSGVSGLARALGADLGEGPPPLQPTAPKLGRKSAASEVIAARLVEQLAAIRRLDPQVRLDIADSVHKMRTAIRRLRSALATFRPLLDHQVTDPVRDELKWFAGVLGEARDTEVFHQRLHQLNEDQPRHHAELTGPEVMPFLDRVLHQRYRRAHQAAVDAMESERYSALLDDLQSMVAGPTWRKGAARPAKQVLPDRVAHDYGRLRDRIKAAEKATDPEQRAFLLHEARKAAKRTRYAAETLVPAFGKDAKQLVKALERVQSSLGEHHDSAGSRQEIVKLADTATGEQVNPLALGLFYAEEESNAAQAEDDFRTAWKKASRSKMLDWLK